jgi:hypothetical protein
MEIVHVREIPYDYAKLEIIKYIQNAGDRNVYASELAEKLMLDYDLIIKILTEYIIESKKPSIEELVEENNRLKLELAKRLKNLDKKCCFSITYDYAKVL